LQAGLFVIFLSTDASSFSAFDWWLPFSHGCVALFDGLLSHRGAFFPTGTNPPAKSWAYEEFASQKSGIERSANIAVILRLIASGACALWR
jgi:hypothetical protein